MNRQEIELRNTNELKRIFSNKKEQEIIEKEWILRDDFCKLVNKCATTIKKWIKAGLVESKKQEYNGREMVFIKNIRGINRFRESPKKCLVCKKEFYFRHRQKACSECSKEYRKKYRQKRYAINGNKQYRNKNKERIKQVKKAYREKIKADPLKIAELRKRTREWRMAYLQKKPDVLEKKRAKDRENRKKKRERAKTDPVLREKFLAEKRQYNKKRKERDRINAIL